MSDLPDFEIIGADDYPTTTSVKLNGPPGTGKTTQCALRVGTLLEEHGYHLSNVLWATYRKSLAMDTLDRLNGWGVIPDAEMANPSEGATRHISTMHAIATRLVGGELDVVTGGDRRAFAKERGLRYEKRNAWDDPPGRLLFQVFDYAANNLLNIHDPADREQIPMIPDLQEQYPGDVARAWDNWQDYKAQNEKIDFWEQLTAPLDRDVTPPHEVVVIDEYHDAYPLMAELAEEWISSAEIAIVAGDPLQVVNTYTGARPEFYRRVDLPEVLLDVTHRVTEEAWAAATRVLSNAHTPPPVKRKRSGSFTVGKSPAFSYVDGEGWRAPGPDVAQSPGWMVESYGEDMMFLTRTRQQADGVCFALEKAGILYQTQESIRDGWGARDGMAERTALYNALQRLRGVEPGDRAGFGLDAYSDTDGRTPGDVTLRAREAAAILDHAQAKHLSQSRPETTETANRIDAAEKDVSGGDLREFVEPEFWRVYSRAHGSTRHLITSSAAKEGERLTDRDREALRAALKRNNTPVRSVDTKVYTIHASKGGEAKSVVVYDGITNRIAKAMEESESERRNEYRTWYVALTRASANTFLLRGGFNWIQDGILPPNLLSVAEEAHASGVNA